ncbi:hypothetical protein JDV02_002227 [Purpureocillium takamizusanense]|uniref:Major facilitator superfamily transporter n=1 Tax=Purpureocillium takamizusanense TaxID=2060973 RepID=A0A9Q8QB52_9HYPO|nr:uncharacterized protein JDV02_002227 [Purpureocillium takamizusanense]UNI15721.1 hypothetical protein JDV02_002227 [Purpureocillium takamizusanense]
MERAVTLFSRSSSRNSEHIKSEPLLPCSEKPASRRPGASSLLGNCLYRRVFIWTILSLALVSVALLNASDISVPDAVAEYGKHKISPSHPDAGRTTVVVTPGSDEPHSQSQEDGKNDDALSDKDGEDQETNYEEQESTNDENDLKEFEQAVQDMPWLLFKHLDGYFHGLKALVHKSKHIPEYPNKTAYAPFPRPSINADVPKPRPYRPYQHTGGAKPCYLDDENRVSPPDIYAYDGLPQHMPDPAIGSYNIFGIRDDVCFDRFGRYGPYGLGYGNLRGGTGVGIETESSGSDTIWEETGQINYNYVDWGKAQKRCSERNRHRLLEVDEDTEELPWSREDRAGKKGRIAVVVRCYQGFKWTETAILNFRAMVTELSLKSGGEYTVHLLLHVRDEGLPIWADDITAQQLLDSEIPSEFHSMVTFWSETQMKLFYPGNFDEPMENPSNTGVHGVYRSAHLALQVFATQNPEYEYFWNWEMDIRVMGSYYELLDRIGRWADDQPRELLWERNERYYVPDFHRSWDNFTQQVRLESENPEREPILGPVRFDGRRPLRSEQWGSSMLPDSCSRGQDRAQCGVGEGADLITLNPIFDVERSGWVFANDATGYGKLDSSSLPRRCSIVTASRLSRRLLLSMHEEVWRYRHTMFSEMFPATVALHHGLKAVYAPHPIYLDRAWQPLGSSISAAFNGGEHNSTSGTHSPYGMGNEHIHKGASYYYHSEFSGLLWRRWLGYAQLDGRGHNGGRGGQGTLRGGAEEESREGSSGRLCLRSMLLHPIKHERPSD